jgi:hypothetical protein
MREARRNLTDALVDRRGADRTTLESLTPEIAVLAAIRDGASINAAATASGINYRTARRIAQAANRRPDRERRCRSRT